MKNFAAHITFYNVYDRIKYLKSTIAAIKTIDDTDIFVHTNKIDNLDCIKNDAEIVTHNLDNRHPYTLVMDSRDYIARFASDYDYSMYIEDDIDFSYINFNYYKKYHSMVKVTNKYLGFMRIEHQNANDDLVFTDITSSSGNFIYKQPNYNFFSLNESQYQGMWILDTDEL